MDALTNILTRRSIRAYKPDPIDPEILKVVLEATMYAPSAGDQEPWHFVVIQNRDSLKAIAEAHPYASFVEDAPAAILVCADTRELPHPLFWPAECGAATQNLMLSAHAQGLGTIWIGIHPRPERVELVKRLAVLPDGVEPFALVPIGYPAETPEQPFRFNEAKIHAEKWLEPWEPHRDWEPHHHFKPGDPAMDPLG